MVMPPITSMSGKRFWRPAREQGQQSLTLTPCFAVGTLICPLARCLPSTGFGKLKRLPKLQDFPVWPSILPHLIPCRVILPKPDAPLPLLHTWRGGRFFQFGIELVCLICGICMPQPDMNNCKFGHCPFGRLSAFFPSRARAFLLGEVFLGVLLSPLRAFRLPTRPCFHLQDL